MERVETAPRENWEQRLKDRGFLFYEDYWSETAHYKFTERQIDVIEDAANNVYQMFLAAAEDVFSRPRWWERMGIPESQADFVKESWQKEDPTIYGRFDFIWDGKAPPKVIEFNGATPTSLYEASVVQWDWFEDRYPDHNRCDQFNNIHNKLVEAWSTLKPLLWNKQPLAFVSAHENIEDRGTAEYMMEVAREAGIEGFELPVDKFGWHDKRTSFVDLREQGKKLNAAFALYPHEWLFYDMGNSSFKNSGMILLEPAWKSIMTKAILPVVWEMNEGHENLLPTYDSSEPLGKSFVAKSLFGREGRGVSIYAPEVTHIDRESPQMPGERKIYQAYQRMPNFNGYYPVIGVWMAGGNGRNAEAVGMSIREDRSRVTGNNSRFVPHCFTVG